MNQFKVTLYINSWSQDPTEWIAESVQQNLEEGEELTCINTIRYSNDEQEDKRN